MAIKYFGNFPFCTYTLDSQNINTNDIVTNIFRRVAFLHTLKSEAEVYYPYMIKESDTPEIIAHKLYGSADYYWVVTMFNQILDPVLDWPMTSQAFDRYIQRKYGSIQVAKTTIHHYTKTITKMSSLGESSSATTTIDQDTYNSLTSVVPVVYSFGSGYTLTVTTTRDIVHVYDYEFDLNESKRSIKLLKEEYLTQARAELARLLA